MKKELHRSHERGITNTDWLHSRHSFSFANFYDPHRLHFGVMRVLNDDLVQAGRGFDLHPHRDMEIISIPLRGSLKHIDDQGHEDVIHAGDVQVMTAGKGIRHSEYNYSEEEEVAFLQIWIFPDRKNLTPAYAKRSFPFSDLKNHFLPLVSRDGAQNTLSIHQDVTISYGTFSKDEHRIYTLTKPGHGCYLFLLSGEVEVEHDILTDRDGIALEGSEEVQLFFHKDTNLLVFDVAMQV
jgi:hypothetical protein